MVTLSQAGIAMMLTTRGCVNDSYAFGGSPSVLINEQWTLQRANNGNMEMTSLKTGAWLVVGGPVMPGIKIVAGESPFGFEIRRNGNYKDTFRLVTRLLG
jgi:hypothetical protein